MVRKTSLGNPQLISGLLQGNIDFDSDLYQIQLLSGCIRLGCLIRKGFLGAIFQREVFMFFFLPSILSVLYIYVHDFSNKYNNNKHIMLAHLIC